MRSQRSAKPYPPLSDAELEATEDRARQLPEGWLREAMLRLIAEARRARAALGPARLSAASASGPPTPALDPDYTPPGGKVTMGEWQAMAARLEAKRGPLPPPYTLSPEEREECERRWSELRRELKWDTQAPLTAGQEAELDELVRKEIQAHRREKQRKRDTSRR